MHRPPTLATVAEATPHERGVLRARLLRPAGRHAMVVAHFFESGQRRRLRWGRVESAPLMAGAVSAGQHRVHSCDRRKGLGGPRRLGPGVRVPHSVSRHCPRNSSRAEYARRKVESPFGAGADRSPVAAPGQAVVRRTVP